MSEKTKGYVVALDGPAGAGKSTVSALLAKALGGVLLDTGAMYRSVAYFALKQGAKTATEFSHIAQKLHFEPDKKSGQLLVNKVNLGQRLRTPAVSAMASHVSRFRGVRRILTSRQRGLARKLKRTLPIIVEGRDIGTVVFPDVEFKFYVAADAKIRARRRYLQLKRQGTRKITFKQVLREQRMRDKQDMERTVAPLRVAKNAVVVDTSSMGVKQVAHFMRDHIHFYRKSSS